MFAPPPLQGRFSINLGLFPAHDVLRWTTWPNSYKPRCSHDNRWSCGREIHWMWNSIFRAIKDRSIRSVSVRWAPPSCPHQAGFEITNSQVFFVIFSYHPLWHATGSTMLLIEWGWKSWVKTCSRWCDSPSLGDFFRSRVAMSPRSS